MEEGIENNADLELRYSKVSVGISKRQYEIKIAREKGGAQFNTPAQNFS